MRQKDETTASFNQIREITEAIQAQKNSAQISDNANTSEIASQSTLTPKARARTKNSALKPTKKAFSERQKTTIRETTHKQVLKKSKGGR